MHLLGFVLSKVNYDDSNKLVVGKMKDETAAVSIE